MCWIWVLPDCLSQRVMNSHAHNHLLCRVLLQFYMPPRWPTWWLCKIKGFRCVVLQHLPSVLRGVHEDLLILIPCHDKLSRQLGELKPFSFIQPMQQQQKKRTVIFCDCLYNPTPVAQQPFVLWYSMIITIVKIFFSYLLQFKYYI